MSHSNYNNNSGWYMTTAKKTRKPRNYINNRDLLKQVALSKEAGQLNDTLAHMLTMLCKRYATRGQYVNYTYNEDMQAYAMMMICKTWHKFDAAKSDNPFAFYTQCIKHSFIQFLNQEKRQRDIRDELLVDNGLNPSFSYQIEKGKQFSEDDLSVNVSGSIDTSIDY